MEFLILIPWFFNLSTVVKTVRVQVRAIQSTFKKANIRNFEMRTNLSLSINVIDDRLCWGFS